MSGYIHGSGLRAGFSVRGASQCANSAAIRNSTIVAVTNHRRDGGSSPSRCRLMGGGNMLRIMLTERIISHG